MQTAYYTVFYQLLRFVQWVRVKDTPEVTALLLLSFVLFMNGLTLYTAIVLQLFPLGHRVSIPGIVGTFSLLIWGNYRLLLHHQQYQLEETIRKQRSGRASALLVVGYFILSGLTALHYFQQLHDLNVFMRR